MNSQLLRAKLHQWVHDWDTLPVMGGKVPLSNVPLELAANTIIGLITYEVYNYTVHRLEDLRAGDRFSIPGGSTGVEIVKVGDFGRDLVIKIGEDIREVSIFTFFAMIDNLGLQKVSKG